MPPGSIQPEVTAAPSRLAPERALVHPAWLVALALLLVNDHVFKAAGELPALFTGKASDFAGLFVAPVLLAALVRARSRAALLACHAAVGLGFVALKLVPAAATAWVELGARLGLRWQVVLDPSDLLALPMLLASWRVLVPCSRAAPPHVRGAWRRAAELAGLVLGLFACVATSKLPPHVPTARDGQVVIAARGDVPVHVLDLASGQPRAALRVTPASNPPSVAGGVVLTRDADGLAAVSLVDGVRRWTFPRRDDEHLGEPVADDARVYVHRRRFHATDNASVFDGEQLTAIDLATGREQWSIPVNQGAASILVPGALLLAEKSELTAIDPATGQPRWAFRGTDDIYSPIAAGPHVFFGDPAGTLHALDRETGHELWTWATGSRATFGVASPYHPPYLSAVDGLLFFVRRSELVAFDLASQRPRWTRPDVGAVTTAPGIALAQVHGKWHYVALDPATGQERWQLRLRGGFVAAPRIEDGVVVMNLEKAGLRAYDLADGRLRWTFDPRKHREREASQ
ncbi:PQQ-binding-like beta-propeller repeat protein [Nannocystis punicea]|uniref:PQQ-like beta-propeller repeat protein n=1 Tax=Nannocystis punicea TaxID=2995304 RepID=A0ABY7GS11_9BACT|nr:PQQ-binding-like beta-propeller repeat protein [Nannocystis poenicansa]WAS89745.1 PQQ-like beta-propeller repeat protein [Nannocystis poenicansa]